MRCQLRRSLRSDHSQADGRDAAASNNRANAGDSRPGASPSRCFAGSGRPSSIHTQDRASVKHAGRCEGKVVGVVVGGERGNRVSPRRRFRSRSKSSRENKKIF